MSNKEVLEIKKDLQANYVGERVHTKSILKNIILCEKIQKVTSFLSEKADLTERVYAILNNLKEIPPCLNCGKPTPIIRRGNYSTYCSTKCASIHTVKKRENTCIERYGVSNPFQSSFIKDKIKKTNNEKYGSDNPSSNDSIKKKKELTSIKNRGTAYYMQSEEAKEKKSKLYFERLLNNSIIMNFVTPLFTINDYTNRTKKYKWKCNTCDYEFKSNLDNGKIPICRKCNPYKKPYSSIEIEIQDWLEQFIEVDRNERFYMSSRKYYEADIYLPTKSIAIDFHGLYWHSEIGGRKDKHYHIDKMNYFLSQNIQYIQIWANEWIKKKSIVKSILMNKINLSSNRLYARNCKVQPISSEEYSIFIEENHLQGYNSASIKIGLFYEEELVQIIAIAKSRYNKKYQYELIRACSRIDYSIIGGFSKLLTYFIREYKPTSIISYADRRYSDGQVYKKMFKELKDSPCSYFYLESRTGFDKPLSRMNYQKHKLKDKLDFFDPNLTEWENMQQNGFDRIWDCGNKVFVLNP